MTKKMFSMFLVVAMILSMTGFANATELSNQALSENQLDSMKVVSATRDDIVIDGREPFTVSAGYDEDGGTVVTFVADKYFIQENPSVKLTVSLPNEKSLKYEGYFTSENPFLSIEGLLIDTEYHVFAVCEKGVDVASYVGQLVVLEKDDILSPIFQYAVEVYKNAEYVKSYVQ